MQTRIISELQEFRSLQSQWRSLLQRSAHVTVFQSFEWQLSWLESFTDCKPHTIVASEGDNLLGVAPLLKRRIRKFGLKEDQIEFIGAPNFSSDYCDFIIADQREDAWAAILTYLVNDKDWSILKLHNLSKTSPSTERINSFFTKQGCSTLIRQICECPRWVFGEAEKDAELLKKKSLKRHLNYFQREGKLLFKELKDKNEIRSLLDPFFDQHIARRAITPSPSLFINPKEKEFYRNVLQNFDLETLRFAVLLWNEKPIAFHFGFKFGGTFVWYKPSFDPQLSKHSPGEVLLWHLFQQAIAEKTEVFDFTVGGEGFKYRFSNQIGTNNEVVVFRRKLSYALEKGKRAAAALKRSLF